jgi:hypothetical protein
VPSDPNADSYLLPIFPLQQVVLFPHVNCPLHIFEPRYRQMTEAALAGERRIGMIAVLPEHVDAMAGDPPVFAVGCEGEIAEATRRPDGRFDILLVGTQRFRILEEPPRSASQLYRSARVQPLDDAYAPSDRARVGALRARMLELLAQVFRWAGSEREFDPARFARSDDVALVNGLCQLLQLAPAERQSLLEADDIPARYGGLIQVLQFQLAARDAVSGSGSRQLH